MLWAYKKNFFFNVSFLYLPCRNCNFSRKENALGFPGGAVVGSLPASAGGHGFEPWSRRIPHDAEQLKPGAYSPCSATGEATAMRGLRIAMKEWPPLAAARESPCAATKTQSSQKFKN